MLGDPATVAALLALGLAAGFLAGLLGVGGGMVMVPFLTWLFIHQGQAPGLAVKQAIASSMATIVFTSLSSVWAHQRRRNLRWDIVRGMAPGIVAGGLLAGAGVFAIVKGTWLALCFAAFVGYSATQMLRDKKPLPSRTLPGWAGQSLVGAGVGLGSGLVGAGGAFISVPFMTWCNVGIQQAVGTSAALGFPIAMANTVGYVIGGWNLPASLPGSLGYVVAPAVGLIAVASVLTVPLGARAALAMDTRKLKRLFALLLYGLAASMLWRAFAG